MSQKVIIGIETVRYNLIEKFTQNNVAPNIKRLMKHGTLKRMSSFIPEVSSADCGSITDIEPEQYGVYGFTGVAQGHRMSFTNFDNLKSPRGAGLF